MLRYAILGLLVTVTAVGCGGGNKVEMPKDTVSAPTIKDVQGIGASSGKGGLPQPPGSGQPAGGGGVREPE